MTQPLSAPHYEQSLLESWHSNAEAWTTAVRERHIESRRVATDAAIIDAVLAQRPHTALDLGCGEGWLVRALGARGVAVTGVDAIPVLIDQARAAGGEFRVVSYADIGAGKLDLRVDAIVCNFSLLGDASVKDLLTALPRLLMPGGCLIVQTVHPWVACGAAPYVDGWREEDWAAFGNRFTAPAPWYFRTMGGWMSLLASTGWRLRAMREPLIPDTQRPASVIFTAQCAARVQDD